jgi:hypothetical protein
MPGPRDTVRTDKFDKAEANQDFEPDMQSEMQMDLESDQVGKLHEAPVATPVSSAAHNPMSAEVSAQGDSSGSDAMLMFDPIPMDHDTLELEHDTLELEDEAENSGPRMGGEDDEEPSDGDDWLI